MVIPMNKWGKNLNKNKKGRAIFINSTSLSDLPNGNPQAGRRPFEENRAFQYLCPQERIYLS